MSAYDRLGWTEASPASLAAARAVGRSLRDRPSTVYRVSGTIAGGLWWPVGAPACKTFEYQTRERPASLDALAETICDREGGDFSTAPRLLADCILVIRRDRSDGRGHRSRVWPLTALPSLSDYTSPEWPE
jgi:hypothetical protein